jgi:hypothetical protein
MSERVMVESGNSTFEGFLVLKCWTRLDLRNPREMGSISLKRQRWIHLPIEAGECCQ